MLRSRSLSAVCLTGILVLCVPAALAQGEAEKPALGKEMEGFDFLAHPSLRALCDDQSLPPGEGGKPLTRQFYSEVASADLVGFYRGVLGDEDFTPTRNGGIWRLKKLDLGKDVVLEVLSSGEQIEARCDSPLPEESRSVILISLSARKD